MVIMKEKKIFPMQGTVLLITFVARESLKMSCIHRHSPGYNLSSVQYYLTFLVIFILIRLAEWYCPHTAFRIVHQ